LYFAITAFFQKDLRTLGGISIAEITQRLASDVEVSNHHHPWEGATAETDRNHGLIIPCQLSSVYSTSPSADFPSPPPVSHSTSAVTLIRKPTKRYAKSTEAAFFKLETREMKVASLNWSEIAQVVMRIEQNRFAGRNINHPQVYGLVLSDRLMSFEIRSLQHGFDQIENNDFSHVIFLVDRNSAAERLLFSGRSFHECCEELHAPESHKRWAHIDDNRPNKRQKV